MEGFIVLSLLVFLIYCVFHYTILYYYISSIGAMIGVIILLCCFIRWMYLEIHFDKSVKSEIESKKEQDKERYKKRTKRIADFYRKCLKKQSAIFLTQKSDYKAKIDKEKIDYMIMVNKGIKNRILEILEDNYLIRFPAPSSYHQNNQRTAQENSFISKCKTITYIDYINNKNRFSVAKEEKYEYRNPRRYRTTNLK